MIFLSISMFVPINAAPPPLGDNGTISGYVHDESNNETLIGVTVYLENTKYGNFTNKSGFFSIANIPPGEYNLIASSVGYEKYSEKIIIHSRESKRMKIKLRQKAVETESITIEAEREVEKREITISKVSVPVAQIKNIRIGGEADVFRSLQYLPGILASSQISTGLFIRGGSPDQNLVLLDGSTVYNPTHLFGFISTFNPEAVKDVELIKGGFPAEFGNRLSAVLNITQKDGNRNKFEGLASIGTISSRISLEGPIGKGSWFIGGRRTYFELIKALLPDDPDSPIPDFNFYDVNGKITQDLSDNDKVFISGFVSKDNLDYASYGLSLNMNLGNRAASARWTHIFGDDLFSVINLSGSHYFNGFIGDNSGFAFEVENSITDYTLKASMEWFANERMTNKFGYEVTKFTFNYLQNITGDADTTIEKGSINGGAININIDDWNHSFYSQINDRLSDAISLQAGFRINYWANSDILTFDPRLALRYLFSENLAIKASWGIYSQNLRLASNPDFQFFDTWMPTDSTLPASRATHYILSLETKPIDDIEMNVDVYYKQMKNTSEINRFIIEGRTAAELFWVGNTSSYGMEIFLQKQFGRINGWIGYALGYVWSKFPDINGGNIFKPKYDRRHDFKIVLNYQLSDDWTIGGTFTFQSGQSYTGATSRFQSYLPGQNIGKGFVVPSQLYGLRLPPSHQLNLTGSYSFSIFELKSKLILDIFNVYNRRDIWFRYYDTKTEETKVEDVRLLPIIPSISLEVKF